jgi:hypothetical protein
MQYAIQIFGVSGKRYNTKVAADTVLYCIWFTIDCTQNRRRKSGKSAGCSHAADILSCAPLNCLFHLK